MRKSRAELAKDAAQEPVSASQRVYKRWLVIGIAAASIGALAIPLGQVAMGVALAVLGLLFAALAIFGRVITSASSELTRALDHVEHRRFAEAQRILDALDAGARLATIRRAVRIQRGLIAMRRGDVERAIRHLDEALAHPPGRVARWYYGEAQEASALGLRSFLRATRGDAAGARRDAAAARAIPAAVPSALAYVALGEAVLAERSGDRAALRAELAREEALLLEATGPRERAIVRAYQRMVQRTAAVSVYRQSAPRESSSDDAGEPALAEWIASVAPGAAPFVIARKSSGGPIDAPPVKRAGTRARAPAAARVPWVSRKVLIRALALSAAIIGLTVLAVVLSQEDPLRGGPDAEPFEPFDLVSALGIALAGVVAVALGVFAVRFAQARRAMARLSEAARGLGRGDLEGAAAAAAPLAVSKMSLIGAQADLVLAGIAERRGDLREALRHCDQGLSRLSEPSNKALASDVIEPSIQAERAFALAALDRRDEAMEALEAIDASRAPFAAARLRVEVLLPARHGDLAGAAEVIARCPPDLSMSRRDELLADVVRAAVAPDEVGRAEIGRLREELRGWALGRSWLDAVAPAVLRAFERVATEGDEADGEEAAEREADAEAEAEAEVEAEAAADAADAPRSARRAARIA